MVHKTSKMKAKRKAKGYRTHVRRMKQEAAKAGTIYKPTSQ
jgi:hypothetical protein